MEKEKAEMKVKSITITDFKGVVGTVQYDFNCKNVAITAQNGCGKTTIADSFYWLFFDKSYDLTANPNIRPNDGRECTPTVTVDVVVNDKEISLSKIQKMRVSKPDSEGVVKKTLINTYEINAVPKTDKDFKRYLEELGIDVKNFLPLSHPDVFLKNSNEKKQREEIRRILFNMADNSLSDLEISQSNERLKDLSLLLDKYNLEEVSAMQISTMRKISEVYGNKGEILRAKIDGMESSKTHISTDEIKEQKSLLRSEIQKLENKLLGDNSIERISAINKEIAELNEKMFEIERAETEKLNAKKQGLKNLVNEKEHNKFEMQRKMLNAEKRLVELNNDLGFSKAEIKEVQKKWTETNSFEFNEADTTCPYCGQTYPDDKIEQLKMDFAQHKADEIAKITEKGNSLKTVIEQLKLEIAETEGKKNQEAKALENCVTEIDQLLNELNNISELDLSVNSDYQKLKEQLEDKKKELKEISIFNSNEELKNEISVKRMELSKVEKMLALADKDKEIDSEIQNLREKGLEYEQQKADCEKIFYQISLLNKIKNEMLEDNINKHFSIVKWKMFDFRKNGEYLDDCTPLIDGKNFNDESNGALRTLAKIDIINGLQEFYKQYLPMFIDDFSLVTSNTENRIKTNCQLITLKADESEEIKIEVK